MFEVYYNNLAKVQDTRKADKETRKEDRKDFSEVLVSLNQDRENFVNVFGGTFRVRPQKAA
ncbi:MAG: hypothetical protein IIY45_10530 [Firmicutes bacterium]|jgi:hypothetical protein|nr:hypothetical protein [Bacillota bacterium]MBR3392787.1 hypothetical protein [Bacillota bacterium]